MVETAGFQQTRHTGGKVKATLSITLAKQKASYKSAQGLDYFDGTFGDNLAPPPTLYYKSTTANLRWAQRARSTEALPATISWDTALTQTKIDMDREEVG